jgi:hypothetical protein
LIEGDIVVGTGLQRMNKSILEQVETYSTDTISASNLIKLFRHQSESEFFEIVEIEELNPHYITSSQVNNSNV